MGVEFLIIVIAKKKTINLICLALAFLILVITIVGLRGGLKVARVKLFSPRFSAASGFYDEGLELELSSFAGGNIYFTFDGSDPRTNGILYSEPIRLIDPTNSPNVLSARTDISTGYMARDDYYVIPEKPVDKIWVIKAVSMVGSSFSDVVTNSYFIGFNEKDYSTDIKFVSLSTEMDNLFDYEKGIYVTGKRLDEFFEQYPLGYDEEEGIYYANGKTWQRWWANYTLDGRESERPAHIDIFDADRTLKCSNEVGMRIKGGATRAYAQKSINLYTRDEYSEGSIFPSGIVDNLEHRNLCLFSGANDTDTKIRDALVQNLCEGLNFANLSMKPCYLFLNGEYWGVYYLSEHFSENFIQENYGIPADDVVRLKNMSYVGDSELNGLVENSDFTKDADYQALCEKIDIDSFIDYYATLIYLARCEDWPGLNEGLWKSRTVGKGQYRDGRYRWMIYDLNWSDSCMNSDLIDFNGFEYVATKSELFRKLQDRDEFREQFADRFITIADSYFNEARVLAEMDDLVATMRTPMAKDLDRYYGANKSLEDFDEEIDSMRSFFKSRRESAFKQLNYWKSGL